MPRESFDNKRAVLQDRSMTGPVIGKSPWLLRICMNTNATTVHNCRL